MRKRHIRLIPLIAITFVILFSCSLVIFYFQQKVSLSEHFNRMQENTKKQVEVVASSEFQSFATTLANIINTSLLNLRTHTQLLALQALEQYRTQKSTQHPLTLRKDLKHNIRGLRYSKPDKSKSFVFASSVSTFDPSSVRLIQASETLSNTLAFLKEQNPFYSNLYIIGKDNMIRIHPIVDMKEVVPRNAIRPNFAIEDSVFFKPATPAMNPEGAYKLSKIYHAELSPFWLISSMQPIYDSSEFLGSATIDLRVNDLFEVITKEARSHRSDILLLDQAGALYATGGSFTDKIGFSGTTIQQLQTKDISSNAIKAAMSNFLLGKESFVPLSGENLYLASADIGNLGLKLILVTDYDQFGTLIQKAMADSENLIKVLFSKQMTSITIILLGVLAALFALMNYLLRPIPKILNLMRQIGKRTFNAKDAHQRITEFQELANTVSSVDSEVKKHQENEKVITADAARGKLAAQVIHDLRSPLSALTFGLNEISNEKDVKDRFPSQIELLQRSLKSFNGIIDSLMCTLPKETFDDSNDGHIQGEWFEIHECIESVISEVQKSHFSSNISYHRNYYPKAIFINPPRIDAYRVFSNIIRNAVEAVADAGDIRITTKFDKDNSKVCVQIEDNGCGMSEDVISHIFERNFTQGKENGTGEGLFIVKELADKNKFTIDVKSSLNVGSVFSLSFSTATDELKMETDRTVKFRNLKHTVGQPVLVLDDDASMRSFWQHTLSQKGVDCVALSTFDELLKNLPKEAYRPTFIIDFDLKKHSMTGLDVIDILRSKVPRSRFYLCSGQIWDLNFRRSVLDKKISVLQKPIDDFQIEIIHEQGI